MGIIMSFTLPIFLLYTASVFALGMSLGMRIKT